MSLHANFAKLMAMSMTASMLLVSPVTAASNDAENGIVKTTYETEHGTVIEGMISGSSEGIATCALACGDGVLDVKSEP